MVCLETACTCFVRGELFRTIIGSLWLNDFADATIGIE